MEWKTGSLPGKSNVDLVKVRTRGVRRLEILLIIVIYSLKYKDLAPKCNGDTISE